ncbi:hypothetical protein C9I87_17615 [Photobacterium iliopiscarium]|nr:hypothetical protein [Photobacterium iliopiscarium]PST87757.1 hypothetical protein C9I87_17615 [Photobacterium iliopiscarium]
MKYFHDFVLIESYVQLRTFFFYVDSMQVNINKTTFIIRFNGIVRNDNQIKKLLKEREINDYISFLVRRNIRSDLVLMIFKCIYFISNKSFTKKRFFIGDYYSKWMKIITKTYFFSDLYYLDDGLASISAYKSICINTRKVNLITEFNLESNDICKVIKLCRVKIKKETDENKCLIIGMPMIEHQAFVNTNLYMEYLIKIKNKFKNHEISYAPHRYENIDNIKIIGSLGFNILNIDMSIEDYIEKNDKVPLHVVSLYSSALIYINSFYDGVKVYYFYLNCSDISEKFRGNAMLSYEYMKTKTNIEQVE